MTERMLSVVMAVYNAREYLDETMQSVLQQTHSDFEFIIVHDSSTDGTRDLLDTYDDPRIVIVDNPRNIGLSASMNRGFDVATGKYIARMDADDICTLDRFQIQLDYMEAHEDVGVVGTNYIPINADGELVNGNKPKLGNHADPAYFEWSQIWVTTMPHPTAMIRRSVLEASGVRYDPTFTVAQDFDFWTRLSPHTKMVRLQEVGLYYRLSDSNLSARLPKQQLDAVRVVCYRQLDRYLDPPIEEGIKWLLFQTVLTRKGLGWQESFTTQEVAEALKALLRLYRVFEPMPKTDEEARLILWDIIKVVLQIAKHTGRWRLGLQTLWKLRSRLFVRLVGSKSVTIARRRAGFGS